MEKLYVEGLPKKSRWLFPKGYIITDVAFIISLLCAMFYSWKQIPRPLVSTDGVLLSHLLAFVGSAALMLWLLLEARKTNPGREISQLIFMAILFLIMGVVAIAFVAFADYQWSDIDTNTSLVILVGLGSVYLFGKTKKISFSDPIMKGLCTIVLRVIPQFAMVWCVYDLGGDGVTLAAILVGHASIGSRLTQIGISIFNDVIDDDKELSREKLWVAAADVLNWVSWAAVTVVWIWV